MFAAYNDSDIINDYDLKSWVEDSDDKKLDINGMVTTTPSEFVPTPFTNHAGNLDPRIDFTVGRRDIDINGWGRNIGKDWIRSPTGDISGPFLAKKTTFHVDEVDQLKGSGDWGQVHSGLDYNIMRFADVLLMGAEAAVEVGGASNLELARGYVNQVRNRAKNMTYVQALSGGGPAANYVIEPYTNFSDQGVARMSVRFERRIELGMEGHRMYDLRRWGTTTSVLNEYVANEARTITNFGVKAKPYTATYDLLPIPLTSIDLSGGVLIQNPGY